MLLLKRHLVELVRSGKKRQTIRLWSRPLLRPGQISYTPGLGKMHITAVDELPSLSALTESDAIADGFPTLAALLAEIRRIYGQSATATSTRRLFRIQFDWPWPPDPKLKTQNAKLKTRDERGTKVASGQRPVAGTGPAANRAVPQQNPKSKIKNQKSAMTSAQRQSLRHFILAHAPHSAPGSASNSTSARQRRRKNSKRKSQSSKRPDNLGRERSAAGGKQPERGLPGAARPARKTTIRKPKIKSRKSAMASTRRRSLRRYILARAPHSAASKKQKSKTKN